MLVTPLFVFSSSNLAERLKEKILLAVEDKGKTYYVHEDGNRYRITVATAQKIFEKLALGITNNNLEQIPSNDVGIEPEAQLCEKCEPCEECVCDTTCDTICEPVIEYIEKEVEKIVYIDTCEQELVLAPSTIYITSNSSVVHEQGDSTDIIALVKNTSGQPLPNQIVIFQNGNSAATSVTGSDGKATIKFVCAYDYNVYRQTDIVAKVLIPNTTDTFIVSNSIKINAPYKPSDQQQGYFE